MAHAIEESSGPVTDRGATGSTVEGNWGDAKLVGSGVTELRIDYGPGYRLYATRVGRRVVLMLAGGDKSSQRRDIAAAEALAKEYHDAA